ncbi:MAG: hypothetical protein QG669_168 [Patescibacteria group bacterium]|nr:hypothetical protein [Patescibacteria group bacterium]
MTDTNHYKAKLLQEKDVIIDDLKNIGRIVDPVTQDWEVVPQDGNPEPDSNDLADRFEDFEEKSSEMSALEARLKDVNDALKKIDDGAYGKCEVGGEDIEEARLGANPAARTCMEHMNG